MAAEKPQSDRPITSLKTLAVIAAVDAEVFERPNGTLSDGGSENEFTALNESLKNTITQLATTRRVLSQIQKRLKNLGKLASEGDDAVSGHEQLENKHRQLAELYDQLENKRILLQFQLQTGDMRQHIPADILREVRHIKDVPDFVKVALRSSKIQEGEWEKFCKILSTQYPGETPFADMPTLVEAAEKHKETCPNFFYCALLDPKAYQRLVPDLAMLIEHANQVPDESALIDPLLNSSDLCAQFVQSGDDFFTLLDSASSEYTLALISRLLYPDEHFKSVFKNPVDFSNFMGKIKGSRGFLFRFRDCVIELANRLVGSEELFRHCFKADNEHVSQSFFESFRSLVNGLSQYHDLSGLEVALRLKGHEYGIFADTLLEMRLDQALASNCDAAVRTRTELLTRFNASRQKPYSLGKLEIEIPNCSQESASVLIQVDITIKRCITQTGNFTVTLKTSADINAEATLQNIFSGEAPTWSMFDNESTRERAVFETDDAELVRKVLMTLQQQATHVSPSMKEAFTNVFKILEVLSVDFDFDFDSDDADDRYMEVVKNLEVLDKLMCDYPERARELVERLLESDKLFKHIFTCQEELQKFINDFDSLEAGDYVTDYSEHVADENYSKKMIAKLSELDDLCRHIFKERSDLELFLSFIDEQLGEEYEEYKKDLALKGDTLFNPPDDNSPTAAALITATDSPVVATLHDDDAGVGAGAKITTTHTQI